jgi:hypothetical protein
MKNPLRTRTLTFGLLILLLASQFALQAQSFLPKRQPLDTTKVKELNQMARQFDQAFQQNQKQALSLAKKHDWVTQKTFSNGRTIALQGLDALGKPIYYTTHSNAKAAATTQTSQLHAGGSLGLTLSGNTTAVKNKLGTWDGGKVRATHQELTGRITQKDSPTATDDHATHTSGTMIGAGINPIAKGMAYQANLLAWDYNNDASEMAAAASGLLISNHSYGEIAGWSYNSDRAGTSADPSWEWWGDTTISKTEDYKFGYYSSTARSYDLLTYNAPYYLPVFSAGNNRGETGPAVGQPYYRRSASGTFTRVSARPASLSANNGFDVISGGQLAKNILTVGAVYGIADGYHQASDVLMSEFSSWGPTDDGRIKPDLVGDGVDLTSSVATADNAYATYSGTSMSAPNVSGSLLLLQELYAKQHSNQTGNNQYLRAATLKALVIHTADEAGQNPGPDYQFGWGLLNAGMAAQVIINADQSHVLTEKSLSQGETYTLPLIASGKGPLVATIAWTDPAATILTANQAVLNNRTARLVNDLDIRISDGTTTNLPWTLDPAQPAAAAKPGDNIRDNVEQVLIANAVAGKTYTLTVKHKGTLNGNTAQTYALVISGIGGQTYCTSLPSSNQGARINRLVFGQTDTTFAAGCSTYQDLTNLATDVFPGQTLSLRLTLGSCAAQANKMAKVFVDWNGDQDFADANELMATSGIISGTGDFLTSIQVPVGLVTGNSTRMRIICSETSNASDIVACGTYARGETQDYRLRFVQSTTDVGVIALVAPTETICANTTINQLIVTLKNFGSNAQKSIPVTVTVSKDDQTLATFTGTFMDTLAAFGEKNLTLSGQSFITQAGTTYSFTVKTTLSGDTDPANNSFRVSRTVSVPTLPTNVSAAVCGTATNLAGGGDGTLYWYTAPNGGSPLAIGNQVTTSVLPANYTYYAGLNDFKGTVGPSSKSFATDGGYNQFSPGVLLTTYVPLQLDSARLYIGHSGQVTFTIKNVTTQVEISSVTLAVTATRNPAVAYNSSTGQAAANDASDTGKMYALGLSIPTPGNYEIAISYADGATIFRNNQGVSGYPFTINQVVSLTGNTADASGGTATTSYYYYLYNLQVKALGCPGSRLTVIADTTLAVSATIHSVDTILCNSDDSAVLNANTGKNLLYQWKKNGTDITSATEASYVAHEAGSYSVLVSNESCSAVSKAISVVAYAEPTVSLNGNVLSSSMATGNQWLRSGVAIPGASQQTYTATSSGRYSLQSKQGTCLYLSEEMMVVAPGEEGNGNDPELSIYPNPTTGSLTLDYLLATTATALDIALYDSHGTQLLTREIAAGAKGGRAVLELGYLPNGMYVVKATDGNQVFIRKLIKQ